MELNFLHIGLIICSLVFGIVFIFINIRDLNKIKDKINLIILSLLISLAIGFFVYYILIIIVLIIILNIIFQKRF